MRLTLDQPTENFYLYAFIATSVSSPSGAFGTTNAHAVPRGTLLANDFASSSSCEPSHICCLYKNIDFRRSVVHLELQGPCIAKGAVNLLTTTCYADPYAASAVMDAVTDARILDVCAINTISSSPALHSFSLEETCFNSESTLTVRCL
jgi:hypothetical protein